MVGKVQTGYCAYSDFCDDADDVPAYRAWTERVAAACAAADVERARIAGLQRPGTAVRLTRRVIERINSRRFVERAETVVCTVARLTETFLVAADGRRYGLHTIQTWASA